MTEGEVKAPCEEVILENVRAEDSPGQASVQPKAVSITLVPASESQVTVVLAFLLALGFSWFFNLFPFLLLQPPPTSPFPPWFSPSLQHPNLTQPWNKPDPVYKMLSVFKGGRREKEEACLREWHSVHIQPSRGQLSLLRKPILALGHLQTTILQGVHVPTTHPWAGEEGPLEDTCLVSGPPADRLKIHQNLPGRVFWFWNSYQTVCSHFCDREIEAVWLAHGFRICFIFYTTKWKTSHSYSKDHHGLNIKWGVSSKLSGGNCLVGGICLRWSLLAAGGETASLMGFFS